MSTETLLIIGVIVAGFAGLYFLLQRHLGQQQDQDSLEKIVNQVFGLSVGKITEQSRQVLASDKDLIKLDLENKQKVLESLIQQLQGDLKVRQDEIRVLEQDRSKKFGEISAALEQQRALTDELKVSTQQLATVLSNNQSRGAWGERIIEDLLQANGLMEGVHYLRQAKQLSNTSRPDITLLLPNKRNVPVDVKFPYAEIQKMTVAEGKAAKEVHLKQFGVDLKTKINKVAAYIDPEQETLDYAILFVPNEMVFSFINQKFPDLVDEAMSKRVIMVSPFTFVVVARTVMESYRNFMISDKLKEVVKYVDEFVKEWGVFKSKFEKYGRSLDVLKGDYEELSGTRVRQMERKIEKIEGYRHGSLIEAGTDVKE